MPRFQCLTCAGVYISPQSGIEYFHVCPLRPDPAAPVPGEGEEDKRDWIGFQCARNENIDRKRLDKEYKGKSEGRGRRPISDVGPPPNLPPENTRPCRDR